MANLQNAAVRQNQMLSNMLLQRQMAEQQAMLAGGGMGFNPALAAAKGINPLTGAPDLSLQLMQQQQMQLQAMNAQRMGLGP